MAQVAAEAEVAVGTLYLYFKDKKELQLAVLESRAEWALAAAGEQECRPSSPDVGRLAMPDALVEMELETLFLPTPRSRRDRESGAKRREILDAAARVFARDGFHPTTMAQVAAEAEVAVGTLYLYFKTKENLYFSLVEEKVAELLFHLRAASLRCPTAREKLRSVVVAELQFFARNREFFRIHFFTRSGLASLSKDESGARVDRQHSAYLEIISAIIKQGIDDGDLRAAPCADLAQAFVGMLHSVVGKWVVGDDQESLTAKADWLLDFFFRAAAADGGLKE
jgi:AcrR family transcriptional regulator